MPISNSLVSKQVPSLVQDKDSLSNLIRKRNVHRVVSNDLRPSRNNTTCIFPRAFPHVWRCPPPRLLGDTCGDSQNLNESTSCLRLDTCPIGHVFDFPASYSWQFPVQQRHIGRREVGLVKLELCSQLAYKVNAKVNPKVNAQSQPGLKLDFFVRSVSARTARLSCPDLSLDYHKPNNQWSTQWNSPQIITSSECRLRVWAINVRVTTSS